MMISGPSFRYISRSGLNAVLVALSFAHAGYFASAEPGAAMMTIEQMTPGSPSAGLTFALSGAAGTRVNLGQR
jgi:hypothetical protein